MQWIAGCAVKAVTVGEICREAIYLLREQYRRRDGGLYVTNDDEHAARWYGSVVAVHSWLNKLKFRLLLAREGSWGMPRRETRASATVASRNQTNQSRKHKNAVGNKQPPPPCIYPTSVPGRTAPTCWREKYACSFRTSDAKQPCRRETAKQKNVLWARGALGSFQCRCFADTVFVIIAKGRGEC